MAANEKRVSNFVGLTGTDASIYGRRGGPSPKLVGNHHVLFIGVFRAPKFRLLLELRVNSIQCGPLVDVKINFATRVLPVDTYCLLASADSDALFWRTQGTLDIRRNNGCTYSLYHLTPSTTLSSSTFSERKYASLSYPYLARQSLTFTECIPPIRTCLG